MNYEDEDIIIDLELTDDDISVDLALNEESPGAMDHQDLNGRSLPNQHPISAITNLDESLVQINNEIIEVNNSIINLQDTKQNKLTAGNNIKIINDVISSNTPTWGFIVGDINNQQDLQNTLSLKENTTNKVTTISQRVTNNEYPSAKSVYDFVTKDVSNLQLTKLEDYLYTLHYNPNQMNYQRAIDYLYEKYHPYNSVNEARAYINGNTTGACSGVRKGNFVGRNYDWTYSEAVSFVVTKEAPEGKYKSIGIAGGFDILNKQSVESREYYDIYNILPYMLVDGINEKGLVVTLNVVPVGEPDTIPTTGTHPEIEGDSISMLQLPSYLLDNFGTAQEAINWIQNSAKIYGMYNENIQEEMHVLVADKDNTFIVEFVNNRAVIHSDKHAMTNFYLTGVEFDENGYPIRTTLTPHAQGVERYEIIMDNYNNINSSSTMREMMSLLTYTKAYDADPLDKWWMTEFVSDYAGHGYPYPDLTVLNTPQDFVDCGLLERILYLYEHRTRDGVSTWQTIHSSVYDIEKRQFTLIVQEGNIETEKTFQLFPNIGDGNLILKTNNTIVGKFSANQNMDTEVDIEIPDTATWGNIIGNIQDQEDLQEQFSTKSDGVIWREWN